MAHSLIFTLLACTGTPEPLDTAGDPVALTLLNPTAADPFRYVDTLLLSLVVNGEVVETVEASWDEDLRMPALREYGLVRFELTGTGAGRVRSYGRTAELLLSPGQAVEAPLVFLPINEALPLLSSPAQGRADHLAWRAPDGRVLLIGGRDPAGGQPLATVEAWLPWTGAFEADAASFLEGLAAPRADAMGADLFVAGGEGSGGQPSDFVAQLDPVEGHASTRARLSVPRAGHCFTVLRSGFGLALGGAEGVRAADYLRPDAASGEWNWTQVLIEGLDAAEVSGCARVGEGVAFLQGRSAEGTGLLDFSPEAAAANPDISAAFTPASAESGANAQYVTRAMVVPLPDGGAWIGGGQRADTGTAATTARRFDPSTRAFSTTTDPELPRLDGHWGHWVEEGWVALGCGTRDGVNAQAELELIDLVGGARGPRIALDAERRGCAMTVLDDGSLLVTGGEGGGAALAVPYPWPTDLD